MQLKYLLVFFYIIGIVMSVVLETETIQSQDNFEIATSINDDHSPRVRRMPRARPHCRTDECRNLCARRRV
ncbi:hypothetical protein I4U23_016502 [Adineta vaga]|nr:hypothetical protein I4U23_016502 [Adineta vaga]